MQRFEADPATEAVLMIGEIGGSQEVDAALWAQEHMSKPLVAFIAGATAPPGRRMGHAGAIISGESDTAQAKMQRLEELGVHVVKNAAEIGRTVKAALS
jgi:succinyl-CoA synthetase alpha subunit